jgi:hypothetical protein
MKTIDFVVPPLQVTACMHLCRSIVHVQCSCVSSGDDASTARDVCCPWCKYMKINSSMPHLQFGVLATTLALTHSTCTRSQCILTLQYTNYFTLPLTLNNIYNHLIYTAQALY